MGRHFPTQNCPMVPWACPSQYPEQHHDQLSHFCTPQDRNRLTPTVVQLVIMQGQLRDGSNARHLTRITARGQ